MAALELSEPSPHADIEPSTVSAVPTRLLLGISFWGGLQIMALEICGLRMLTTYLGSSVFITGTLLTLYMVLLSAGYYLGGRLSTRWGQRPRGLFGLLLAAALYAGVGHGPWLESLGDLGLELRNALEAQPFLQPIVPAALLTLVLYGPPVLVTSMISPFLIRLRAARSPAGASRDAGARDAGVEAGFFMSLSTIGSIAGTMFSSYVAVPLVGVRWTALVTSVVSFGLASAAWIYSDTRSSGARRLRAAGVLGTTSVAMFVSGFRAPPADPSLVYRAESHYGELEVYQAEDAAGRRMLTYHPSRVYMHSMLFPEQPLWDLEGDMYFISGLLKPPKKVLVLGSAAGGALRGLELAFPGAALTGVDLDPKVHEVATRVFGVNPSVARLVTADARVFLMESVESFDLIIVDLFAGEFIPSHCITQQFFELVRRRLSPRGSVFINTNMNDVPFETGGAREPFRGVRHLQATLRAAGFEHLFENTFFNSIYTFAEDMSIERFRAELEREWRHGSRPAPLRAAAGLALYSTFAVDPGSGRYRPFTDAWTPDFLIELKGNERVIYSAVEEAGAQAALPPSALSRAPRPVLERLLARHLAEWRETGDKGFVHIGPLTALLSEVPDPLGPGALDAAARYLQFAHEPDLADLAPRSPWAELAALYARMHALGHANRYEPLLEALEAVHERLPAP
ncbi:fused MFS/spermidine synthase [Sorangium sp. So ce542]|uniref:fused MFS/spermidine synthase n=1 Tax=Sorangium sp. So ce542 TaxID=3133316 RepID=UPI003F5DA18A